MYGKNGIIFLALFLPHALCSVVDVEAELERLQSKNVAKGLFRWESSECPTGWALFEKSCYIYGNEMLDWDDAQKKCIKDGGYLAEVESPKENEFLVKLWTYSATAMEAPWLGATDRAKEGEWKWASGKPMTFTFWSEIHGEPNGGTDENCLNMHHRSKIGRWNDSPCSVEHGYICEKKILL